MGPAAAIPGRAAGAPSALRHVEKELSGGEAATTNNRMELMAAIAGAGSAEAAVPGTALHRQPCICATASRGGFRRGRRAAGGPPTRSRSRTSIYGSAWKGRRAPRDRLALGARPCRAPRKRARRCTGPRRSPRSASRPTISRRGDARCCCCRPARRRCAVAIDQAHGGSR